MKIAIASGKGGTGKTTVATNLALQLSKESCVSLVDLDVEEPNSGIFVKGELAKTLDQFRLIPQYKQNLCIHCNKCQKLCRFNALVSLPKEVLIFPELCHSCELCVEFCPNQALTMGNSKIGVLNHYKGSFDFVEGLLDIGQEQAVPLIKNVKQYVDLNIKSDYKIYDCPPGTSCSMIESIKDASYVIMVTEPTQFGLNDLKLAVATAKQLNKPIGIVINKYGIGNDDTEKYCLEENLNIIAKIPNMKSAAEHYSRGDFLIDNINEVKAEICKIIANLPGEAK